VTFPDINPYLIGPFTIPLGSIELGPLGLRWYALAYIAGIVLGWIYARRLLKEERIWGRGGPPLTTLQLDDVILWITLGVILGGRIGYEIFYSLTGDSAELFAHPAEIFKIWHGGMSFHGGLIGVMLALVIFAARNAVAGEPAGWRPPKAPNATFLQSLGFVGGKTLAIGDLIAPCVPIGLFFGRIANFINGELWGRPTHLPWGMVFCNHTIERANDGTCPAGLEPRHPSQLYEATLEGVVLFLILRWATHKAGFLQRRGLVTGIFLAGYGIIRLLLENVREPDSFMPEFLKHWLTMGMLLSIPMILFGLWLVWRTRTQPAAKA
jgi:phosphatidylglycerol:prolipoprotein diacylglycerol transferase